jgi:uncharacterized membrane-anchored protein
MALSSRAAERITGYARVDRRTKRLVGRLGPGDVAVIDHEDIDRVAADGLVATRPAAVVNAARSSTGRYPNIGPILLLAAGIPVVDECGGAVLQEIPEGSLVELDGADVLVGGRLVASGTALTLAEAEDRFDEAKGALGAAIEAFAANTLDYLRRESHLITDRPEVPDVDVDFTGRHALIVVRGHDYREDLGALRRGGYLAEVRPVLIGVDGGADALLEMGLEPDIVIGDMDSVSGEALTGGAELVVHGYRDGSAPGAERLSALGLPYHTFEATGTSEDIAMLLAHERGAELIVAVGTHSSLTDFLDKGRDGMASTFLVRLRVGPILVDAKGVNRLWHATLRKRDLGLLAASALLAMSAIFAVSDTGRLFVRSLWLWIRSVVG